MYQNYLAYRAAWKDADQTLPSVPLNLDLELSSLCDLRCPFCFVPDPEFDKYIKAPALDGKIRARFMPQKMALDLIDQAATLGIPALKFNWRGEGTLHPDFSYIVWYASQKRCFHDLMVNSNFNFNGSTTTGIMLTTKLMVSLDSTVPELHAKMRVGADFDRVIANIRYAIERNHPNLWIRRVRSKINQDEDFLAGCRKLFGNTGYKVSEHACFDRNQNQQLSIDATGASPTWADEEMGRVYCGYPSRRLVVTATGTAMPCCLDLKETMVMGNVNIHSIKEIWDGKIMRELRDGLKKNDTGCMSETCRACESWIAYDHANRTLVNDVEMVKVAA